MALTRQTGFPVNSTGSGMSTLSVTPVAVGDLLVVAGRILSSAYTVTGVSGGGATGWTKIIDHTDASDSRYVYLWYATVNATGAQTVTITFSGSVTAGVEIVADSITGQPGGATWAVDSSGESDWGGTASADVTFPSLTATQNGMYWGFARSGNSQSGGGLTAGFTYWTSVNGDEIAISPSVPSTSYQPQASQVNPSNWDAVAALFYPAGGSSSVAVSPTADAVSAAHATVVTGDTVLVSPSAAATSSATAVATARNTGPLPTALAVGVASITASSVTLVGAVGGGLAGVYWFEYGTDPTMTVATRGPSAAFPSATASAGLTTVLTSLSGLPAASAYYFEVVAQTSNGEASSNVLSWVPANPTNLATQPTLDVAVPHFSWPFTMTTAGATVAEQDSDVEINSCENVVAHCTQGQFPEAPGFGIPDYAFSQVPLDVDGLAMAIEAWESRARISAVARMVPDGTNGTWQILMTSETEA